MTDRTPATAPEVPSSTDAQAALARLEAMAGDLRGCAIVGPDGKALAATGDLARWGAAGAELLAAADAAAGAEATKVHVATEDGEAFAVRERGMALVAVAERFTLASLILFDMRVVLRDFLRSHPAALVGAGSGGSGG